MYTQEDVQRFRDAAALARKLFEERIVSNCTKEVRGTLSTEEANRETALLGTAMAAVDIAVEQVADFAARGAS